MQTLDGEKWYVLVRVNPPTQAGLYEQPDGSRVWCNTVPATITPININTSKEYLECFLKNGGNFRIVEVKL